MKTCLMLVDLQNDYFQCATRDLVFKGRTVPAADVHAAFMAALSVPYAQVLSTGEIIAGLA
jgi:nicotinamidase-related amidase